MNISLHEGKWRKFELFGDAKKQPNGSILSVHVKRRVIELDERLRECGRGDWMFRTIDPKKAFLMVNDEVDAVMVQLMLDQDEAVYRGEHKEWKRDRHIKWTRKHLSMLPWHVYILGEGSRDPKLAEQIEQLRIRLGDDSTGMWMLHVQDISYRAKAAVQNEADIEIITTCVPSAKKCSRKLPTSSRETGSRR